MPAYLRKAFSFGPFRLNLSKSGLGLSFGVTGLRIGTGPNGPYFHAGRGGLYFRKSLKETQENQGEYIAEDAETTSVESETTPVEPQSLLKKIYVYAANFVVIGFIACLIITIITIYFAIDFIKFALKSDRSNKKKSRKR